MTYKISSHPSAAHRPETRLPEYEYVLAGHFHEPAAYATWRSRGTRDWLLIYTVGGSGRFGLEGVEAGAECGDLVLIAPGTRHDYGTAPGAVGWDLLWAHFHPRPHWLEWLYWPPIVGAGPTNDGGKPAGLMRLRAEDPATQARLGRRLRAVVDHAGGAAPYGKMFAMAALEEVLLECATINPRPGQAARDARLQHAIDYAHRHIGDEITLESLARAAGVSVSRLGKLFRRQVGQSPIEYVERRRMELAGQRLDLTRHPVSVIAAELGYSNPLYFSLRFKKHTGLSPSHYRERELAARGDEFVSDKH